MKSLPVPNQILFGLVVLVLTFTSCVTESTQSTTRGGAQLKIQQDPALIFATPEEAARQLAFLNPEFGSANSFTIRGIRTWWGGVVVLYNTVFAADEELPSMYLFGYVLVERAPGGWFARGSSAGKLSNLPEDLVDYGRGGGITIHGEYNILDGQVLSSEVVAVEGFFDDGQVHRDETDGQVFAFITPMSIVACELRVLGANEQVLQIIDLPPLPRAKPNNCAIWNSE